MSNLVACFFGICLGLIWGAMWSGVLWLAVPGGLIGIAAGVSELRRINRRPQQ